jgi:cytochrome b
VGEATLQIAVIFLDTYMISYAAVVATTRSARDLHRLLAYLFTAVVLANIVSAVAGGPDWLGYIALAPLILMMLTGWYLLWMPHSRSRRRNRAQNGSV